MTASITLQSSFALTCCVASMRSSSSLQGSMFCIQWAAATFVNWICLQARLTNISCHLLIPSKHAAAVTVQADALRMPCRSDDLDFFGPACQSLTATLMPMHAIHWTVGDASKTFNCAFPRLEHLSSLCQVSGPFRLPDCIFTGFEH